VASRHFTISDADKSIRDSIEELRTRLAEEEGVEMSQARVVLWAVKKALRKSKVI